MLLLSLVLAELFIKCWLNKVRLLTALTDLRDFYVNVQINIIYKEENILLAPLGL